MTTKRQGYRGSGGTTFMVSTGWCRAGFLEVEQIEEIT